MTSLQKTALHARHRALEAKMTDFHGWDMPLYYNSIIEEHRAVRQTLGVFDISHMGQALVKGPDAERMLNRLLVSDVSQVGVGRACYTLMLNEQGGILDDLIVYRIGQDDYLVIVNCGNRLSDVAWMRDHLIGDVTLSDISAGRSILAVQGPLAGRMLEQLLDARVTSLGRFGIAPIRTMGPEACIARTGYTGSDGFELFLPDHHAVKVWDMVLGQAASFGALPVGLGARDTLRVEAGLRLYGTDMDAATTPYEADLGWTVAINKPEFIGKPALVAQKQQGVARKFVGMEFAQGPVPRTGCELTIDGRHAGTVTSGTFSPVLSRPLAMGYLEPQWTAVGTQVTAMIRNQRYTGTVVKLPFWKGEPRQPSITARPLSPALEDPAGRKD